MQLSQTEENYLKALFHLTSETMERTEVGTNELATFLNVKPATVNDMLKKLNAKDLVVYEKYKKMVLTDLGKSQALQIVRKHRLWETFLYEKLDFTWDEVHEVAEQLEHIQSEKLIFQLEKFLGYPKVDPHGDVIPNADGEMAFQNRKKLSQIAVNEVCVLVSVSDSSADFLLYVEKLGLSLHTQMKVKHRFDFDGTIEIEVQDKVCTVSQKFAEHIFVV